MWSLTLKSSEAKGDIERAIRALLSRVRRDGTPLCKLIGVNRARLSVAADLPDWTRGFDLSAELIAELCHHGLSFGISIYSDEE